MLDRFGAFGLRPITGLPLLALGAVYLLTDAEAQDATDPDLPGPVQKAHFEALIQNPPFTRTLGASDGLILTGVARIDGQRVATLFNTETQESHVVTEEPNEQGWQLVGIGGEGESLKQLDAEIRIAGGEVVSIRYQKPPPDAGRGGFGSGAGGRGGNLKPSHLAEARKAAVNYTKGFSSDGFPKEPPREIVAKLSKLSLQQREAINRRMISLRNEGLGMEERRRIYVEAVNRSAR